MCPWSGCGKRFHDCNSMLRHMYLMHGCGERSCLCCGIDGCVTVCTTTQSFRMHVQRCHRNVLNEECKKVDRPTVSSDHISDVKSDSLVECGDIEASDFSDMMQLFNQRVLLFSLRIREQFLLPKTTFGTIMSDVKDLVSCYQDCLNSKIAGILNNCDVNWRDFSNDGVLDSIWQNVKSDFKFRKCCANSLGLLEPEEVLLGIDAGTGKKETYHYISLGKTLQHYLQHEDVWDAIQTESSKSSDSVLRDYTDGENFEAHAVFRTHPDAIRLHGYIDDFEVCNPLGSARTKHKLTAVYFYVGNLPKQYTSNLRSIHVALLARTAFVKKYTLSKVLEVFAEDLKRLEVEGITVRIGSENFHVMASLATISADNLGSHQLGGFRMSFSCGRVCRHCLVTYDDLSKFVSENDDRFPPLRTQSVHATHVQSVLEDPTLTPVYGVNGKNALKDLPSFDPIQCLPPDCMHDVLEGVIPITLNAILKKLISSGVLTVDVINERMSRFTYNPYDRDNAPPILPSSFPKKGLLGTASQMLVLMRCLPFVIGDLVNEDNEVWELYLILRHVCDIVFAPAIHKCWLPVLQQLIADNLTLLRDLCDCRLTPKCHYLIHYPRMISKYGPLRHLWCMRFEAYHRYFKAIATSVGNFINISKTLAERNQMKKCYEQAGNTCLEQPIEVSDVADEMSVSVLPAFIQCKICEFYGCRSSDTVLLLKSFECSAVRYAVGDFFVIDVVHEDIPVFMQITHLVAREGLCCIIGQLCVNDLYFRHYHAYSVRQTTEWVSTVPGFEKDFHAYRPYNVLVDGKHHQLVSLRHKLICTSTNSMEVSVDEL
jgi:hypothetical protein